MLPAPEQAKKTASPGDTAFLFYAETLNQRLSAESGTLFLIYSTFTMASHRGSMLAVVIPATLMRPLPTM